jgi:hypothetical protein
MRRVKVTHPVEWRPFGFEFKPGRLVFGEYTAQGRYLFVRDAGGSIKARLLIAHLPMIQIACQMLDELCRGL